MVILYFSDSDDLTESLSKTSHSLVSVTISCTSDTSIRSRHKCPRPPTVRERQRHSRSETVDEAMLLPENDSSNADVAEDSDSSSLTINDHHQATKDSKFSHQRQSLTHHKRRCSRIRSPIELRFPFFGSSAASSRRTGATTSGLTRSNASLAHQKIVESVVFKPANSYGTFGISRTSSSDTATSLERSERSSTSDASNIDGVVATTPTAFSESVIGEVRSIAGLDGDRQTGLTVGFQSHPLTPVRRSLSQGQNDASVSTTHLLTSPTAPTSCRYRSASLGVWNQTRLGRSSSIACDCSGMTLSCSCNGLSSSYVFAGSVDLTYASESYLYHRAASSRRGFGGNYLRRNTVNECSSRTFPDNTTTSLSFDCDASNGSIDDLNTPSTHTSSVGTSFRSRESILPEVSRSMPGTLRRLREKFGSQVDNDTLNAYDQSLLIYLEGRFSSTASADCTSTIDDQSDRETKMMYVTSSVGAETRDPVNAVTGSVNRGIDNTDGCPDDDDNVESERLAKVSRSRDDRQLTIEARWSSVVAGIEARREQQRRAGAIFESAVARAVAATEQGESLQSPSTSSAVMTSARNLESRRRMSKTRQLIRSTRSEENLSIITPKYRDSRVVATSEVASMTSSKTTRAAENCSSDEGGTGRHGEGRRQRRRRYCCRIRERRRRSSWECQGPFDADEDEELLKPFHRKQEKRSDTVPTNYANINGTSEVALLVKKADSFDSGIDTKTDSLTTRRTGHRTSEDVVEVVGTRCILPSETAASADTVDVYRKRVALLTVVEHEFDLVASKLIDVMQRSISLSKQDHAGRLVSDDPNISDVTNGNVAQERVVHCQFDPLAVKDSTSPTNVRRRSEVFELCQTLIPPPTTTAIHYMNGLFDDIRRTVTTSSDNTDPLTTEPASIAAAKLDDNVITQHGDEQRMISELKAEMKRLLTAKMRTLEDEKMKQNAKNSESTENARKMALVVADRLSDKQLSKYRLYVDELGKVLHLLLMLAGRLARAENDVIVHQRTCNIDRLAEKTLATKRDEIVERFGDAVCLKAGIDRRREALADLLKPVLTEAEMVDYERSVEASCRARLDTQWIEDRIGVGRRQLALFDVEEQLCDSIIVERLTTDPLTE